MRFSSSACLALKASTCSVMAMSTLRSVTETLQLGMLIPAAKRCKRESFPERQEAAAAARHVLEKSHHCRHQRGLGRDLRSAPAGGPQGPPGGDSPGDVQGGGNDARLRDR